MVLPLTVQMDGVVELNITAFPESPPVAESVAVPPTVMVGIAPRMIVWLALKLAVTV